MWGLGSLGFCAATGCVVSLAADIPTGMAGIMNTLIVLGQIIGFELAILLGFSVLGLIAWILGQLLG